MNFSRFQVRAAAFESKMTGSYVQPIESRFQGTLASDCTPDDVLAVESGHS